MNERIEPVLAYASSEEMVWRGLHTPLATAGVSWGYRGAKPVECARVILEAALESKSLALDLQKRFVEEVVSKMAVSSSRGVVWILKGDWVRQWASQTENPLVEGPEIYHALWLLRPRLGDDNEYVAKAMQLLDPDQVRPVEGVEMDQTEALRLLKGLVDRREEWATLLRQLRGKR